MIQSTVFHVPIQIGGRAQLRFHVRCLRAQKRSFFVRMVSDPKIYNPAINKAGTPKLSMELPSPVVSRGSAPIIRTQSSVDHNSWISWPLAFLFNSNNEEKGSNVSLR